MINEQKMKKALEEVEIERYAQESAKAKGKFKHTCDDLEMNDGERLAVLMEEVGEVSTEILNLTDNATEDLHDHDRTIIEGRLKAELAQVAAVSVAWMEAIE
jgi:cytidylate kinase